MAEFTLIFVVVTTILWLVIGWRAMRAHENLSHAVVRYVASREADRSAELRVESGAQNRLYRQFLAEDEERSKMTSKERHEAFRKWREDRGGGE